MNRSLRSISKNAVLYVIAAAVGGSLGLADWPSPAREAETSQASQTRLGTSSASTSVGGVESADGDGTGEDGAGEDGGADGRRSRNISLVSPAATARTARIAEISQQAFINSTIDVSNAFHGVIRGAQPNLNALLISDNDAGAGSAGANGAGTGSAGANGAGAGGAGGVNGSGANENSAAGSQQVLEHVLPGQLSPIRIPPTQVAPIRIPPTQVPPAQLGIPVLPEAEERLARANHNLVSAGTAAVPGATGRLALVTRFPNRLDLNTVDAWEMQHQWHLTTALADAGLCTITSGTATSTAGGNCAELSAQLTPSFKPPARGEYERVALQRTSGTHIAPDTYLAAAFELGIWRPVNLHPAAGDIYRQAAASMRLTTAKSESPCQISALSIAEAVESETPTIGTVNDGERRSNVLAGPDGYTTVSYTTAINDLPSIARHAARNTCLPDQHYWNQQGVPNNSLLEQWLTYDAELLGSFRACDTVPRIVPRTETELVRGFNVHPCISEALDAMLRAAAADGIYMRGGGWRSTAQQVSLRISHCRLPSSRANNYRIVLSLTPSRNCTPPTAPPGSSRHESGLAVDFSCGNSTSALGRDRCYRWLVRNAHDFGFYNFVSEPWHWSIDGR